MLLSTVTSTRSRMKSSGAFAPSSLTYAWLRWVLGAPAGAAPSDTRHLQHRPGAQAAHLRHPVRLRDAAPLLGVAVLLVGDPGQGVPVLHRPQAHVLQPAGGGV